MIKYTESSRDYIERTNRANTYLSKNKANKQAKELKKANTVANIFLGLIFVVMAVLTIYALPNAVDQWYYEQYEIHKQGQ